MPFGTFFSMNPIISENDEILIVYKAAGVSAQADELEGDAITEIYPNTHCITRLDKRVSGLMILAKNQEAAAKYSELLKKGKIKKKYLCVVAQKPEENSGTLIHWLKKEGKAKVFDKEVKDSQKAILHYKVLKSSERYHLLEIDIKTGRFHQIRAQLGAYGSPIVGDLKYGFKRSSLDGSIFLSCVAISVENLEIEVPKPEIWEKFGL